MGKRGPAKQFSDEELKERRKARDRERYAANADKFRAKNRSYHAANRETELARNKEFRQANSEHIAQGKRKQRTANADRLREERRLYRLAHKAELLERERKRRESGVDRARHKAWYEANSERERRRQAKYVKENPALIRAKVAARRARKLRATPSWADHEAIRKIYAEAVRLTLETGIPHEVDHIYPLKGKTMCGLHVESNLRIVTRTVNRAKNNRVAEDTLNAIFWPRDQQDEGCSAQRYGGS